MSVPILFFLSLVGCLVVGVFFIVALTQACTKKTTGWIISTVVSVFLGIGLLTVMFGAGMKSIGEMTKKIQKLSETTKTVRSKDGLTSLQVPGNWTTMPELNKEATIAHGNKFKEEYLIVISEPVDELSASLEEVEQETGATLEELMGAKGSSRPEVFTLNGLPAIRRVITGKMDGVSLVYSRTWVATKTHYHQLHGWTITRRKATALPVIEKALASFQATEGPPVSEESVATAPIKDAGPRVISLLADQLGVEKAKLTGHTTLKSLGADDLDAVEIIMSLEEEFDLSIPDEEAEKLLSVDQIIAFVSKNAIQPAMLPAVPETLPARAILRPTFGGQEPEFGAGTAFLCSISAERRPLLLTAHHLFSEAGGLDRELKWNEIARLYPTATAHVTDSEEPVARGSKALSLPKARGMDDAGCDGDIAAYELADGHTASVLPLAARSPEVGDMVYLGSSRLGWCPAKVIRVEPKKLTYKFFQPNLQLRGTSGGPVVNAKGEVVAINLGGKVGKTTFGVGNPCESIRARLAEAK